jgi:hypothetical protein
MDPSQVGVIEIIRDISMIRDFLLRGRGGSNDS